MMPGEETFWRPNVEVRLCPAARLFFLLTEGFQIIILRHACIQRCLELSKFQLSSKTTHGWHSIVSGPHAWITEADVKCGRKQKWTIMKNNSDPCQQIQDIQARKVVRFPPGLRMFVPGQGFGLPLYHAPSTKSTCNKAVANEPANVNEMDTFLSPISDEIYGILWPFPIHFQLANILAPNGTCKNPQISNEWRGDPLLHTKGDMLGQHWSKRLLHLSKTFNQTSGPHYLTNLDTHLISDVRYPERYLSRVLVQKNHGVAALFSILLFSSRHPVMGSDTWHEKILKLCESSLTHK